MEYTKGEWTLSKTTSGHILYSEETNNNIALIYNDRNEQGNANARLIAAAPDMFEALKTWHEHQQGTRGHYCSECADAFDKALAKAKGDRPC